MYVCMYVRTYVRTYVHTHACMYAWASAEKNAGWGGGNDMEIVVGEGLRGGGLPSPFSKKKKLFPEVLRCKMVALFLSNTVAQLQLHRLRKGQRS